MLNGKTVILGVTGSIAAYKMANVASMLVKMRCNVQVVMTQNATNFIHPMTFETLTGNKCLVDTFDRNFQYAVEHVELAKRADLVLIAPATANVIAKLAHGLADDMLTTTVMACKCKKVIAPAMNTNMYENPILQDNLRICQKYGMEILTPASGRLACGDTGMGKLPEESYLVEAILREIQYEKDLIGQRILITAGATREAIDPVRFITNHSTGKMGYALAKVAMRRGATVTVVAAHTTAEPPHFMDIVRVSSAKEMFEAVTAIADQQDIIIKSAAVADYTPATTSDHKMKKGDGDLSLPLVRTTDILAYLGDHKKEGQFLCGFSMETQNLVEHSAQKLHKKKLDMIVANNLLVEGAGFGTDTNQVTLITPDAVLELPMMPKEEVADRILDEIKYAQTMHKNIN